MEFIWISLTVNFHSIHATTKKGKKMNKRFIIISVIITLLFLNCFFFFLLLLCLFLNTFSHHLIFNSYACLFPFPHSIMQNYTNDMKILPVSLPVCLCHFPYFLLLHTFCTAVLFDYTKGFL